MPSALFSPITVGGLHLANRIAVAPMCQYSADDGSATDWHLQHWMMLAISGAGMITVEATAVERRGRISHADLGLYSEANEAAAARALAAAKRVASPQTKFGVQLAHAGRKASTKRPWDGGGPLGPDEDPWQTVAPSAVPFADGWHTPEAMTEEAIEQFIIRFVEAAKRAERAGFDFIELHGAHGYLLHEFLSPLSNRRDDKWGGSLQNRMRLIVQVAREVRAAVSPRMMVGARLSATEWVSGGFDMDDAVEVSAALKSEGLAYICASSGGNAANARITASPGYQVPFAERIKAEAGIVTRAVGLITEPEQAERIVAEGRADLVAIARAVLADPRWPWRAAVALGQDFDPVPQYARSASTLTGWVKALQANKAAA